MSKKYSVHNLKTGKVVTMSENAINILKKHDLFSSTYDVLGEVTPPLSPPSTPAPAEADPAPMDSEPSASDVVSMSINDLPQDTTSDGEKWQDKPMPTMEGKAKGKAKEKASKPDDQGEATQNPDTFLN